MPMSSAIDISRKNNTSPIEVTKLVWQRYGVVGTPFSALNSFNSFFPTQSWPIQYQDFKTYLNSKTSPFLIISGKQGTGRYSILEQFINRCSFQGKTLRFTAQLDLTFDKILKTINKNWSISEQPNDTANINLDDMLINIDQRRLHLIVFNNAEKMPLQVLAKLIASFVKPMSQNKAVKIIFVANDSFSQVLSELVNCTRLISHIKIQPLTEIETENYLRHRLHSSGLDPRYILKSSIVSQLFKRSGGKTSVLNNLIRQYLPSDLFEQAVKSQASTPEKSNHNIFKNILLYANNAILNKGILVAGILAFGFFFAYHQEDFKLGRFIISQKFGGMKIPSEHLVVAHRPEEEIFKPNSGYNVVNTSNKYNTKKENSNDYDYQGKYLSSAPEPENDYSTWNESDNPTNITGRLKTKHHINYSTDDNV